MAGVGFELNRILARRGIAATLEAYTYAGLIGSGPWLIAVLTLATLGVFLAEATGAGPNRLLFVAVAYVYSLTLILTGPVQLVLTRHAADKLFLKRPEEVFSAFLTALAWTALGLSIVGLVLFGALVPGPILFRLAAAFLMTLVGCMWVAGIFLTALKNYRRVLVSFALGFLVALGGAWWGGSRYGVSGAMLGLVAGHLVVLMCLLGSIVKELGGAPPSATNLLAQFRAYWDLALCGFLYNLGVLGDKFVYWWVDPSSEQVAGILYASPVLDRVVYFSFLTIIPGMAVFLLRLETAFAAEHSQFFEHVLKKGTLSQIHYYQDRMIEALREGFHHLLKVQGAVTFVLVIGAQRMLNFLGLGAVQAGVLQVSLIGVFLLVIFLATLTVLHYLDKRRDALIACLLFAGLNLLVSTPCALAGDRFHGIGFLVATACAAVYAAQRVNGHLNRLDYDTFATQPL